MHSETSLFDERSVDATAPKSLLNTIDLVSLHVSGDDFRQLVNVPAISPDGGTVWVADAAAGSTGSAEQSGPSPENWTFDPAGHLLSIPGRFEAKYDKSGNLSEAKVFDDDRPRTTTYTASPGSHPGTFAVHRVYSETRDGKETVLNEYTADNRRVFTAEPYFTRLGAKGPEDTTTAAVRSSHDVDDILGGVTITMKDEGTGVGAESTPEFVGSTYNGFLQHTFVMPSR